MELRIVTDMARVLPGGIPARYEERLAFDALGGEAIALQAAYRLPGERARALRLEVNCAAPAQVFLVRAVPVAKPVGDTWDDDYLSTEPGLYPDCLEPLPASGLLRASDSWQSALILLEPCAPGAYPLTLRLTDPETGACEERRVRLAWAAPALPAQTLKYTRWFHCDALAEHYGVPVFSERHWALIRAFLVAAVRQGVSMILTPIHTPPLDTAIGAERATVQLVDIAVENGEYRFGFEKLDRWVRLCTEVGIRYFELAHLYTQWGALATPKIIATVDGVPKRIFGWDTPACSPEYAAFLARYLPALTARLRALGVAERCYFHISDEPEPKDKAHYLAARDQALPFLEGFPVLDALSSLALYREGVVTLPVPDNAVAEDFLAEPLPERWTYYCCGQTQNVSNSFIAMPGERTRILGVQLYRHRMDGFLHWALNFYYNERACGLVNPYLTTDGEGSYPAGDPFNLYPGPDGTPRDSLRSVAMRKALEDMRALALLERYTSRAHVCALIDGLASAPVTFRAYPRGEGFLLALREQVNREIVAAAQ